MATNEHTNARLASQPSLRTLPGELRNRISHHVLAGGLTRPLLVSRLMHLEAQTARLPDRRDSAAIEKVLNGIVSLHPLSRSCRQLRKDFQPLFLHANASYHRFIINNFDLAQIEFVAKFIHRHCIRICLEAELEGVRRYFSPYDILHLPMVQVDFLGDSDILKSAEALLKYLIIKRELPRGLTTLSTIKGSTSRTKHINTFSPHSQLSIRCRTPDMSPSRAARAVTGRHMEETSRVFMRIESVIHNLDLEIRRPESWSEETVYWIRHVWEKHLGALPSTGRKGWLGTRD
jgi:hypothetical protein